MNTVLIYQEDFGSISFVVLQGSWERFEGVYIGAGEQEQREAELYKLLYNEEDGSFKQLKTKKFPKMEDGDKVVVCGFCP